MRRRMMMGKGLPYDAELGWIATDGDAYIDTLVKTANTTTFELSMHVPVGVVRLFGSRIGSNTGQMFLNKDTSQGYYRWFYGNINVNGPAVTDTTPAEDHIFSNTNDSRILVIDGTISVTANASTFSGNNTFFIFCSNNAGLPTQPTNGTRLYYGKIYSSGNLVRDYVPVRKGQVGYLYDKVSGQLFGNAGTGQFILGQDK